MNIDESFVSLYFAYYKLQQSLTEQERYKILVKKLLSLLSNYIQLQKSFHVVYRNQVYNKNKMSTLKKKDLHKKISR